MDTRKIVNLRSKIESPTSNIKILTRLLNLVLTKIKILSGTKIPLPH